MVSKATNLPTPVGYERKFRAFIRLCKETQPGDYVIVCTPCALGDDYDEMIESLNRLADARVALKILPRSERRY